MEKKICSKCKELKLVCNYQKNSHSKTGYRSECSECSKIAKKLIPKEKILLYNKNFRENNREKLRKKQKEYYFRNKDKELLRMKLYRLLKPKTFKLVKNKEKLTWQKRNKELLNKIRREKYKNDTLFRLSLNVRNRMNSFLKSNKFSKTKKTYEVIGCDVFFLKKYIENKFSEGMSWSNRNEWHIDHIIPLSSAKSEDEIYKLCHYTNLQPLWRYENLKKGGKII